MSFLTSLIAALRKVFAPFPHLPSSVLTLFLPFVSWYVFVRGLLKVLEGLRQISWGFHYSSLPRIFTSLIDVHPAYFFVGAVLSLLTGVLYLKSYSPLTQPSSRKTGWQKWALAAALLTLTHIYEVLLLGRSAIWLVLSTTVGWYMVFEFERAITRPAATKKRSRR